MRWAVVPVLVAVLAAGCSGSDTSDPPDTSGPSDVARDPTSSPTCPNEAEGGLCLGELDPGTSYTTQVFNPAITYSVPAAGWNNFEDLFGNFLLVPPGQSLESANGADADYLGVYRSLSPSRTVGPTCHEETRLAPGQSPTVRGMWKIYADDPLLSVTSRRPVSVGGLRGIVGDIELRPGATLPKCRDGDAVVRVMGLFTGTLGSHLDHGVVRGMTMRLYLLEHDGRVLGIEICDGDATPASLDDMSAVAESLEFAT